MIGSDARLEPGPSAARSADDPPERPVSSARILESQAKALLAARAALDKQAEGVVVMDLRSLSTVTDFFVVCTAGSAAQIRAIQEHLEETLRQHRCRVWHTEGRASGIGSTRRFQDEPQWVLMDCGDVVVHLLDPRARAFYRLEELWADAPRVSIGEGRS